MAVTNGIFSTDVITGDTTAVCNRQYICNSGSLITITLPVVAPEGAIVSVVGVGAGGFKVVAPTGVYILDYIDITSTTAYNCITLQCSSSNSYWSVLSSSQTLVWNSARGVIGSGSGGTNTIDYINIVTGGNAQSFGGMSVAREQIGACVSATRAVFQGGYTTSESSVQDYVEIATTGNASSFGNLLIARHYVSGLANATRGLITGGYGGSYVNTIDKITIASTNSAALFGYWDSAGSCPGGAGSSTRGIWGSYNGGYAHYNEIATDGNASDFGTSVGYIVAGLSSSVRAVYSGSYLNLDTAQIYYTIASLGNYSTFGNLTVGRSGMAGCSSNIKGVFCGGGGWSSPNFNVCDIITIASTSSCVDFGDLTVARYGCAGNANCHGGLQ